MIEKGSLKIRDCSRQCGIRYLCVYVYFHLQMLILRSRLEGASRHTLGTFKSTNPQNPLLKLLKLQVESRINQINVFV